jgi:hypothetical protein
MSEPEDLGPTTLVDKVILLGLACLGLALWQTALRIDLSDDD